MSTMTNDEIVITVASSRCILAYCKFSAFNKNWPDTVEHEGVAYKFDGQHYLSPQHGGHYAGCAKYMKTSLYNEG